MRAGINASSCVIPSSSLSRSRTPEMMNCRRPAYTGRALMLSARRLVRFGPFRGARRSPDVSVALVRSVLNRGAER